MPEKKIKTNKNQSVANAPVIKTRREKLSNYLIDISKYVMTGVVIASLIKDLDDNRLLIYILGVSISISALCVGLLLTDKKKGE